MAMVLFTAMVRGAQQSGGASFLHLLKEGACHVDLSNIWHLLHYESPSDDSIFTEFMMCLLTSGSYSDFLVFFLEKETQLGPLGS